MNDHARRLVHDQKRVVLEDDRERDRLRDDLARGDRWLVDDYTVTDDRTVARLLARPVDHDVPVGDERRRLSARKSGSRSHKQIEANVVVRLDEKLVPLARAQISTSWPPL